MKNRKFLLIFTLVSLFTFASTLSISSFFKNYNSATAGAYDSLDAVVDFNVEGADDSAPNKVPTTPESGKGDGFKPGQSLDKEVEINGTWFTTGLRFTRHDGFYSVSGIGLTTRNNIVIPAVYDGLPVTAIDPWAFCGSNIASVIIPETVTTIGDGAFSFCASLESVTMPNVHEMGEYVFRDCYSLKNVAIGKSTTLGARTFWYCNSLESIKFSDNIKEIGEWTFYECDNLIDVTFGGNSVGEGAFWGCEAMEYLFFNGTYSQWDKVEKGAWWSQWTNFQVICFDDETPETPDETPETPDETPEVPDETPEVPDETPETPDETPDEDVFEKEVVVEQSYQNSKQDGTGSMLWTISVSVGGNNAKKLLEEDGLYLIYFISYGDNYGDLGWYAFCAELTVAQNEENATALYGLSNITKSLKFAIVKKAPSDSIYGGYADGELSESDFLFVTDVYYNEYFEGNATETPDKEVFEKEVVVEQSYQNSKEDGTGSMLWTISVSVDGKNAQELLEEDGFYLVYFISYGDEFGNSGWYAFDAEMSVAQNEKNATVFYGLPNMTMSVKFAIVKKAPSDSAFGSYADGELSENDFLFVTDVYYNAYFEG